MASSSQIYGSNVFDLLTMQKKLPQATYAALKNAIETGVKMAPGDADAIAHAMMEWALSKGVTHYTHWFQPMTGLTAQKHDAFLDLDDQSRPIERFSGNQLSQSEPDASSFPSGGMRSTFEARGYTAWDPSSPVFIIYNGKVPVLCIPSVFFSYTGHALDKKTPLLRSIKTLDKAASESVALLINKKVSVQATIGVEQEYFLIDRKYYKQRADLLMAGRTLLGCRPAKGQQMEDHYFGSIKDRVIAFMADVELELYKLGIPCKTRHNEVAPHQFEMAPIFEDANLAADHNQLTMETLKKVAKEHDLAALLHEKPFADVNGSGKHLNWSLETSDGTNLLEPGSEPHRNLVFLYFLVAVVNAVHQRGPLLRATIAWPANDHRLGANEAPPAIMSVFLGSHVSAVLDALEAAEQLSEATVASIDLGLAQLPHIKVDNTDRNRTSPFAFTGNKFEFRAVGSSQSISISAAVLNSAVADSLNQMNAELARLGEVNEKSVFRLLRGFIKRSKPIRFEGNNYSEEWAAEAKKRGLLNLATTPEALAQWETEDNINFAERTQFLKRDEILARTSIRFEHYEKTLKIEANLMIRMINRHVLPAGFRYQKDVAESISSLKSLVEDLPSLEEKLAEQLGFLESLSDTVQKILKGRKQLAAALDEVESINGEKELATAISVKVVPLMSWVRQFCDELETLVDKRHWDLPGYHQLLFLM